MSRILIWRVFIGLLTIAGSSVAIFFATEILPGDITQGILGQNATPELVHAIRAELGLDRPAIVRYFDWLGGFLSGDLGRSLATKAEVSEIILPRLKNTFLLAGYAAVLTIPFSFGLGVLSAVYANRLFDRAVSAISVFLVSIPEFAVALILVIVLAVNFHLFPAVVISPDWANPLHASWQLFLPMLTLLCTMMAHIARMTRAAVLDILSMPYIEFAILRGVPRRRILLLHVLPNAAGLIINVIALNLGYLISGVAVIEVVFSYPGLGRLMVDSIAYRDLPLIQSTALIFCAIYVTFNLIADLGTSWVNPSASNRSV